MWQDRRWDSLAGKQLARPGGRAAAQAACVQRLRPLSADQAVLGSPGRLERGSRDTHQGLHHVGLVVAQRFHNVEHVNDVLLLDHLTHTADSAEGPAAASPVPKQSEEVSRMPGCPPPHPRPLPVLNPHQQG